MKSRRDLTSGQSGQSGGKKDLYCRQVTKSPEGLDGLLSMRKVIASRFDMFKEPSRSAPTKPGGMRPQGSSEVLTDKGQTEGPLN